MIEIKNNIINELFTGAHSEFDDLMAQMITEVMAQNQTISINSTKIKLSIIKSKAYLSVLSMDSKQKKMFFVYFKALMKHSNKLLRGAHDSGRNFLSYENYFSVCQNLFKLLIHNKLNLTEDIDLIEDTFLELFNNYPATLYRVSDDCFFIEPIYLRDQLIEFLTKKKPSDEFIKKTYKLLAHEKFQKHGYSKEHSYHLIQYKMLFSLHQASNSTSKTPPFKAPESDGFGAFINQFLTDLPDNEKCIWDEFFYHCTTAKGSKPSQKWLKIANQIVDEIDLKKYKKSQYQIQQFVIDIPIPYEEPMYASVLMGKNRDLLKGMVWSMVRFHDHTTLKTIANLAKKSFFPIPGYGAMEVILGNACLYVLAQSKGMEGISHLSRLKLRVKQQSTQKIIKKHILEQAKKQGLLPSQIEEIAVQSFGLVDGKRTETFDDYLLELSVTGVGKTVLKWIKPDGKVQKSVPDFVKNNDKYVKKLKKLRAINKELKQASTAQRDRIEQLYTENRIWNRKDFEKYYLNHGLVSTIARKLIWLFGYENKWIPVFLQEGKWQDITGQSHDLTDDTKIRLWHPIDSEAEGVLSWRNKLEEWLVQQPMKQAYREVYLLTDAEINTKTYSNRMASHILKQHQFKALSVSRGWKYSLIGCNIDTREGNMAQKELPSHQLTAQLWIQDVQSDDDSYAYTYVATDQIRFVDASSKAVELINVDRYIFSEVMRDCDLFLGVASVGNDPIWQSNSNIDRPDARAYWQSYSFGDLSEIAQTRKQVLEKLVPRLKIKDIAKVEGNFLVVKGKRHIYKIHINSTNIQRSPNDQYLCIVPSIGKDRNLKNVFLPFEDDGGISLILSKAFMLANDDKITDDTILSQL